MAQIVAAIAASYDPNTNSLFQDYKVLYDALDKIDISSSTQVRDVFKKHTDILDAIKARIPTTSLVATKSGGPAAEDFGDKLWTAFKKDTSSNSGYKDVMSEADATACISEIKTKIKAESGFNVCIYDFIEEKIKDGIKKLSVPTGKGGPIPPSGPVYTGLPNDLPQNFTSIEKFVEWVNNNVPFLSKTKVGGDIKPAEFWQNFIEMSGVTLVDGDVVPTSHKKPADIDVGPPFGNGIGWGDSGGADSAILWWFGNMKNKKAIVQIPSPEDQIGGGSELSALYGRLFLLDFLVSPIGEKLVKASKGMFRQAGALQSYIPDAVGIKLRIQASHLEKFAMSKFLL